MADLEEEVISKTEDLVEDMEELQSRALDVIRKLENKSGTWNFTENGLAASVSVLRDYEQWYNSAYPLVIEYLPDRQSGFSERYEVVRKGLEIDLGFISERDISNPETLSHLVMRSMHFQNDIVSSIPDCAEVQEFKAKKKVSDNITSNEIQKAKELFDEGDLRAAGVITGVVLERHLLTLCETSDQDLDFGYMDGITSLAVTLNEADEIGDDDQRLLEYLSGIRNKCSHATPDNPEKREVERLINQSDEFIRS